MTYNWGIGLPHQCSWPLCLFSIDLNRFFPTHVIHGSWTWEKSPNNKTPWLTGMWEVGWTCTDWEADCRGYRQPAMCNENASFCCWSTSASTKSPENSKPFYSWKSYETAIPTPEFVPFKHSSCNFYPVLKATCAVPPLYGLCSVLHNSSSPLEKPGRLDKDGWRCGGCSIIRCWWTSHISTSREIDCVCIYVLYICISNNVYEYFQVNGEFFDFTNLKPGHVGEEFPRS